jgi:RNA polymerase sigma factor (sigma-70 family)
MFESHSQYLRQPGDRPQLTREQEYELSRRAKTGDREARRILAMSNLARVVATAKKFANRGSRLDDLIQEGNVGLLKAIEHFDPKKNVRFATYAVWWIRAYIIRYLKDNRSQVRGGGAKRQSMVDFSLDAAIDGDSESSYVERLEDPDAGTFRGRKTPRSRRRWRAFASGLETLGGQSSKSVSRGTSPELWRSLACGGASLVSACAKSS